MAPAVAAGLLLLVFPPRAAAAALAVAPFAPDPAEARWVR